MDIMKLHGKKGKLGIAAYRLNKGGRGGMQIASP
jgi:hypothetical protein